jgi:protein O-mannosyl-transferase
VSKHKVQRQGVTQRTKDRVHPPQANVLSWRNDLLKLCIILFLIGAPLAVFWQVQSHEFVNFDDDVYVTKNPHVQAGLTLESLSWAFATTRGGNWHPLTWLSHMLDCQLYGLKPAGHHLTSLVFHIVSTLILFLVLRRMTGALWGSSVVAALFALHPLHVESVAWVAERKDVLSTFFWMLTMGAYIRYVERPKLGRYLLAFLSFALGLMSKPMLVTLPFVLLLLDYWPLRRIQFGQRAGNRKSDIRRLVLEKVPFFALSAVSSLVTFFAQRSGGAVGSLEALPLATRMANALVSYVSYIGKMIWPSHLAVFYPYSDMLPTWQVAGAGLLLVSLSVLVILAASRRPCLTVGWFWYLGTLVPVIGLVQVGAQAMADRYTYVPSIGLFIMMAMGVPPLLGGWRYRRVILATSTGLVLSIFMIVTWLQVRYWRDGVTLFEHSLEVTSNNYVILNNLGVALSERGKNEEAASRFRESLQIMANNPEAHNNLGIALAKLGKIQEAITHYTEALRIKPHDAEAHNNLGVALAAQGKIQEAITHHTEALRIEPLDAEAHNNLGVALGKQGRMQEAITHFGEALRIKPDYADAHYNLGSALATQGKNQEAIVHYTEGLRIKADYAEAHNNLGVALAKQGRMQEAIAHFGEALRIKPDYADAHYNLGGALSAHGKNQEAIAHFEEALRIKPNFAEVHLALGLTYLTIGKRDSALEEYKILRTINPDLATTLSQKISGSQSRK